MYQSIYISILALTLSICEASANVKLLSQNTVHQHYSKIGEKYENLWSYEEQYSHQLIRDIIQNLEIKSDDIIADIGGGTGTWSKKLSRLQVVKKVYCVDPNKSMISVAARKKGIVAVHSDALPFVENHGEVTKYLIKSSIYHIGDRKQVLEAMHQKLPVGGKILIITSSDNVLSFPLSRRVKSYLQSQSSSLGDLFNELKATPFKMSINNMHYSFNISKEQWLKMVRGRFISTLSKFSDNEIAEDIDELRNDLKSDDLKIDVNYYFITLEKVR
jgi:ubiquinone/menaquinone biosynthesis C-methylase UbiE